MPKNEFKTDKSGLKYAQILGVKINITSIKEVLNIIGNLLTSKRKFSLITANPELLVMADRDRDLRRIINSADLVVPDGVGLRLAIPTLPIIKGRELFLSLMALAKEKNWRVFLLGGKGIKNVVAGPTLNKNGEPETAKDAQVQKQVIQQINRAKPDLLFVGFGMPKQEKWISKYLPHLPVGGAMAVGGTFDYVFGKAKLPPVWLEKVGLEWLWRLIRQPWRWARIFNAVAVFPLRVFRSKLFT